MLPVRKSKPESEEEPAAVGGARGVTASAVPSRPSAAPPSSYFADDERRGEAEDDLRDFVIDDFEADEIEAAPQRRAFMRARAHAQARHAAKTASAATTGGVGVGAGAPKESVFRDDDAEWADALGEDEEADAEAAEAELRSRAAMATAAFRQSQSPRGRDLFLESVPRLSVSLLFLSLFSLLSSSFRFLPGSTLRRRVIVPNISFFCSYCVFSSFLSFCRISCFCSPASRRPGRS